MSNYTDNELLQYSGRIDFEKGISNVGNLTKMKRLMERAEAGESLTIGFIGGSITQGSLAAAPENCYAHRVYEWWRSAFPKAEFTYVNGGIGGTTSQFGAARADSDLLAFKPDFAIIEFSVNDDSTEHFEETYEGLVRRVLSDENEPAVMLVHNVFYNNGASAQLMHARVARHYSLPAVSMQSTLYAALLAGAIDNREITPDDLHPNDRGHELVAKVITFYLEKIRNGAQGSESGQTAGEDTVYGKNNMPKPLTRNAYEDSLRYRNDNSSPHLAGFTADGAVQGHITDCFKKGWTAGKTGDSISFTVEGSCIAVQYRKSVKLPAPVAKAVIDGDEENAVILDANFDETWGDKLELTTLLEHGEKKAHKVEITLTETHPEDAAEFYLVSVIGSGR